MTTTLQPFPQGDLTAGTGNEMLPWSFTVNVLEQNFTTDLPFNLTTGSDSSGSDITVVRIILCSILFMVVALTFVGNSVVLLAFYLDSRLTHNNPFNIYIINLAVTDLLVALAAMLFYTFDVLLGYWPFGQFMCGVWIFFDYGMTFASVFTLVAISLDRYWSVAYSIHYRKYHNRNKVLTAIAVSWILVLVVWLAPCIVDRVKWSEPRICKWEPSNNKIFVVFVAIVGHHSPFILLVLCYVRVAQFMTKRGNLRSKKIRPIDDEGKSYTVTTMERDQSVSTVSGTDSGMEAASRAVNTSTMDTNHLTVQTASKPQRLHRSKYDTERGIFITLSYIIFSYIACWLPFHIVFDLSAYDPNLVPEVIYTITFWLTYFNSTLNPFLYAYSNKRFRQAFKNVMLCRFKKS